ncbi:uncharacterized protein LOC127288368 [Leptopilina boulardi]|uniref:uncharacterized protein LOC127288368 n=1 Tax=Leptopilina boulardi TaxID=63433 RepID=UPI0021F650F6|nr:uncharacterized protein LOC127288368 [Leptopilina boulardi]
MNMIIRQLFYLLLFFTTVNVTNGFMRSGITIYGYVMPSAEPQGVIVTKRSNNETEFLYTEEFNANTNPLKLYFNYLFENTGKRQIVEVDNLCAEHKYGTPEYAAKLYVLKYFANTDKCPIKKGTKVTFKIGQRFIYSIENPGCGINVGTFSLFKKTSIPDITPLVFLVNFRGNITGPDC